MLGGLYMDDDSYFESDFDGVIGQDNRLIVASEKNSYNDDCFQRGFHLTGNAATTLSTTNT